MSSYYNFIVTYTDTVDSYSLAYYRIQSPKMHLSIV